MTPLEIELRCNGALVHRWLLTGYNTARLDVSDCCPLTPTTCVAGSSGDHMATMKASFIRSTQPNPGLAVATNNQAAAQSP